LVEEEVFGPVITILKPFKTVEEAIERANNTKYGLACGIFTPDMSKFEKCARKLKFGTVWINTYNLNPHWAPFGGYKQSGFGRDNAEDGLLEYLQTKAIYYGYKE